MQVLRKEPVAPGFSRGKGALRRPRRVRRTESSIEAACDRLAKKGGWSSRKMNGLGFRDWPDRLFLPPSVGSRDLGSGRGLKRIYLRPEQVMTAKRFWCEFKRPGEAPTESQARMHADLRSRGETVHVCDSRERFKSILKTQS